MAGMGLAGASLAKSGKAFKNLWQREVIAETAAISNATKKVSAISSKQTSDSASLTSFVNAGMQLYSCEGGSKTNIEGAINNGQPLNNHRIVPDTEASNLPATKQTSNSSADLLNPDGSVKQRRYYGADGKAEMDIDFNHTDDGTHEFANIHIWDWTKKAPRQDSRR
ncbi:MAG: hypothetical protein K2M46_02985 [Lachnospiraceae bacterium]|nr:hypothetical protein [Lachnospiraceae bacterium]